MPVGTAQVSHVKAGTCPHGMPLGACPVCSGMAGGNSTTKRDIPRNVGEMTYNQCAAIGAMLKAQKAARQRAEAAEQNRLQVLANFAKNMASIQEKIANLTAQIANNMPPIIAKPINFLINQLIVRTVNIVANIPNVISNIVQKFVDITDKLSAIIGEAKNAITKTASEFWNKTKKKLKSMFFIFGADETEYESYKIEETKKTFNLKTFIHKLSQKLKESINNND